MNRIFPLLLALTFLADRPVSASDWANWRGPDQNGVSREKDLPDRFSLNAKDPQSNLVWRKPYGGRSTPLVLNGRVYIINDAGAGATEQERVMCFDASSGEVQWEYKFNIFHTDIVSNRVGWTNLDADTETGNIYAHGVQGLLLCLSPDGKLLWSHSLTEEYGRISGYGGRITSPMIDGDLCIIGLVNASWGDQARAGNRYLALDKRTGVPVWWSEMLSPVPATYYAGSVVKVINGERLLITGGSDGGLYALRIATGELVWKYQVGARSLNCPPVVDGTLVYQSNGEENVDTNEKGCVVCVDAGQVTKGKPKLIWRVDGIQGGFEAPIFHEGRLYVCDDKARLYCLDAKTGKRLWRYKYGNTARGSPVWADGKIYVCEVASKFHILQPGDTDCKELYAQRFSSSDGTVVELNGTPAVANGRIFFNTRDEMICIGKPNPPAAGPAQPALVEPVGDPNAKANHLQIIPADVVLYPGQSVTFKARLFDAQGRFLKETQAAWSLPSPPPPPGSATSPPPLKGTITEGNLTVDKGLAGQQGLVMAKADGLSGRARVRVVPAMPYLQDFKKLPLGRTPAGWVNCQGKFEVVELDGKKVLKKTATNPNPLLSRANAFIGLPDLTNYTVEADMMGTQPRNDMPDMGVVANRYTLVLDGNKQLLRLSSWETLPRVDKTIAFKWQPKVWYRARLTCEVNADSAIVRGKVWPRDDKEPEEWTIEYKDATPNREGSPAIYGYATGILEGEVGAEIFYDNVRLMPNKK